MKENIQKLSEGLVSAVTLLKEGKTEEAVTALEATAETVTKATEEAEAIEKSIIEKDAEIAKQTEEIKKSASLYISADDLSGIVEELASVKVMLTGATEVMKSASTKEDIASISERLDAIEKAKEERNIREDKRDDMKKSAIPGLNLNPNA